MLPCLGRLRLTPTAMLAGHGDGDEGHLSDNNSEPLEVNLPPSPPPASPPVSPVLTRKPFSPPRDEGGEAGEADEAGEGGEADEAGDADEDDDDDDADDSMPGPQVAPIDPMAGARRRNLPGQNQQAATQAKKRKIKENAQKNDPLLKEFMAIFEDAGNKLDKMLLVDDASPERVREEIRTLVFRMAVWFASQPGDKMLRIYGNDGALSKYRRIVSALIKRAGEFNMNDEAELLHKNLMLGVLQTQSARHGMQKEAARLRLNQLMAYARADTKAKREKVNAQERAARKARQAAKAAAGAGSSNDPAPEAPTTADQELAANLKVMEEYYQQGPPLPAAPMTDAELLKKYDNDLQYADAQLEKILAYNKEFAKANPLFEREIENHEQFYQLKLAQRNLLIAKEALRILQLAPLNDPVAVNKKCQEIRDLEYLEVMYEA